MPAYFEEYLASAEMQLLLACCKRVAGEIDDRELSETLERPFDEAVFLKLCRWHGMSILVFKTLVKPHGIRFSSQTAALFEADSMRHTLRQVQLSRLSIDIHRQFESRQIEHLFLKGPVLNQQLFGPEMLRYSIDLDILIHVRDVEKADACLNALGVHAEVPLRGKYYSFSIHRLHNKDVVYKKGGLGKVLDLHWKTDYVETILASAGSLRNSQTIQYPFHGETVSVLADQYNCLYLCLHAAKHGWFRFRWLLDIPLFIRKRNIDVKQLVELAEQLGLQGVLYEAFFLSEKAFGIHFDIGQPGLLQQNGRRAMRRFRAELLLPSRMRTLTLAYNRILLYPKLRNKIKLWLTVLAQVFLSRVQRILIRWNGSSAVVK